MLTEIATCHPSSDDFLSMPLLQPLVDAYQLDKTGSLSSQINVCKLLIASKKPRPASISEVNNTMLTPSHGFPDLRQVLLLAHTDPVKLFPMLPLSVHFCVRRPGVRTFVRSSIKEDRLSALSNIHIENDLAKRSTLLR